VTEASLVQSIAGSDVFVSYASQDAAVANSIVESLEGQGLKCWIAPRDVRPGTVYADAIVGAINEAKTLVLVLSASAMASAHVGREVERAASKRRQIIAFRIDGAPLSQELEYFLSNSQWIDVPALGMPAALAKLKDAVGHVSGSSPDLPASSHPVAHKKTAKQIVIAAAIVVGLGGAVSLELRYWPSSHKTATPTAAAIADKSIAVLPFVDMSEKKDQEYFADGMAEEIIDLLVKVPGLKVIGRTSSFQFKGKTEDLRAIGTQLGVAYVLEGSVRKSGDHLRVTAQLINTKDGAHLWSQTYDRDLSDVLKMQDEIAANLVRALQTEVSAADVFVSRPALRNTEAYTLVLRGLHALDRYDQQGFEQALSDFQRVLELDPTFADAAAGISAAYEQLGEFGFVPAPVAFEQSRQAADHALKLDPNNLIAHVMLGVIHMVYDWDWHAADAEFKLAKNIAPNDSTLLMLSGQQSLILGRWDDALKQLNASLQLDPLHPGGYELLYQAQIRRGHLPEAEAAIRRTLELSPTSTFAHYNLGNALLARGQTEEALGEYLKEPVEPRRLVGSAVANFALGRKGDSNAALALLLKSQINHPFAIAQVYAYRGEFAEAIKWLEVAYAQRDASLEYVKGNPLLKNLEEDPRYKAFLKKMNLPE
jgi:TolB-like protein